MVASALVTGASRGIGRAIALRLARLGYGLFLLARDEAALQAVVAQCEAAQAGGSAPINYLCGDLAEPAYMDAAIHKAMQEFGAIHVLVNNAGAAKQQAVQDADLAAWDTVMDLNFNAVVYLSRQILPGMIKRKSGAIVNISSISGRSTNAGSAIYCASKHALNGFTECMFEDVRDHNIKVSSIMPGFVQTDLTRGMGMAESHMIQPDDVADSVEYVLSASTHCCPTEIVLRPQLRP